MSGPWVLVPIEITDSLLSSSTIAEPAPSEIAWVSGGTYAIGDLRIRTTTHRVYQSVTSHAGVTTLPEDDITNWADVGPTLRWAMFDNTVSTQSTSTTSMSVVIEPGFFNAVAFYGLDGSTITVTVKDTSGGAVIYNYTQALDGPYVDWYEWLFDPYKTIRKVVCDGITPYPTAELTVTVTGATVGVGMICVGDLRSLLSETSFGGVIYGASAEPVDYSYIKINDFGDAQIVKRRNATDLRISIVMPVEDADRALATVQEVLATPVAWISTDVAGYEGLNVFGLGSGSLSYDSYGHVTFQINVKGLV